MCEWQIIFSLLGWGSSPEWHTPSEHVTTSHLRPSPLSPASEDSEFRSI